MTLCLVLICVVIALRLYLCARQLGHLALPGRSYPYAAAVLRLHFAQVLAQAASGVVLIVWLARSPVSGYVWGAMILIGAILLLALIDLAISAFRSFLVDRRFGFNRRSRRQFLGEACRVLALHAATACALSAAAIGSMAIAGNWWWLLLVVLGVPCVRIAGDLYKRFDQAYLRPGEVSAHAGLARRLRACLHRCGFPDAQIMVLRSSGRSSLANAHAEQIGRQRRVVLQDTLLERLCDAQVEAVVAHELGHLAAGHLPRRHLLLCAIWTVVLGLSALFARQAFVGMDWKQLVAVVVLAQPIRFLMQPLLTRRLRAWEYEADGFAARRVPAKSLRDALVLLFSVNASAPDSDLWFAEFYQSHPPLAERLRRLSEA